MNRSLLILPLLLALAVGGWFLFGTGGPAETPLAASPPLGAVDGARAQDPLPNSEVLLRSTKPSADSGRGALKRPLLSLLARSATDGRELEQAQVLIEAVGVKASPRTIQASGTASKPAELDPGSWRVTFQAEGYVSQTREVDLSPGDEESVEVRLVRGARVAGRAEDRFGRPLGGGKLFFLAPGQVHPRFPRDAEGILSTSIDREGNIEPISIPPELYTITYGNLGTPKLKTEGRLSAGEDTELLIVLGGKSVVRFELDRIPDEKRRIEVRLETLDKEKLAREQQKLLENPARAAKLQQKNKPPKERWRAQGHARIESGVGELHRARPGVYRVTLLARPGEYSSEPILVLKEDESVLVRIQTPPLPEREGNRKGDPKLPKAGPLNISIIRNPRDPEQRDDGIYWR